MIKFKFRESFFNKNKVPRKHSNRDQDIIMDGHYNNFFDYMVIIKFWSSIVR